ncbi:uncharacterized protein LOC6563650 [Drosophila grimshawi]|uniref:GH19385 n=1 Tax=Drosophila grimshawi TaxID=7222 RepID=B4JFS6_DROGR|nr:uncharacterized protein LOC6563650 [Drosophila grimshawi]EDV93557.1 GH19385 [Drosophila grimshawi]
MCQIPDNFITSDLVNHLRCDKLKFELAPPPTKTKTSWTHARFLFVFEKGDLNTAAHYLAERMHEPFDPFPIAVVAVQHAVYDEFIERVRNRFHQVKPHVATHPNFERSLLELKLGGVKYVVAPESNAPPIASPIIVTDKVTQLFFSSSPSGVVVLKRFSDVPEAARIFDHEQPQFDAVHLFDERISTVYELAKRITCAQFYVNCFDVCMMPILTFYGLRQPHSLLHNGFHYETLEMDNVWRIIVFPYTTSFVRSCCCVPGQCTCFADKKVCCD